MRAEDGRCRGSVSVPAVSSGKVGVGELASLKEAQDAAADAANLAQIPGLIAVEGDLVLADLLGMAGPPAMAVEPAEAMFGLRQSNGRGCGPWLAFVDVPGRLPAAGILSRLKGIS